MGRLSSVFILLIVANVSTQQSQFNCSKKILFTSLDLKLCCKIPEINLDKYRDTCYRKMFIGNINRKFGDNYSFINPCAVECIFKRTGALENNQLNMSSMNVLLRSVFPNNTELVEILHLGLEKCGEEIFNKLQEFKANREAIDRSKNKGYQGLTIPCSPFAMLITDCTLRHTLINCPENSWINTEVCNKVRNYVKNCVPAKFGGRRHSGSHHEKRKIETKTLKIKNSNL